jgi:hypothetical protein
LGCLFIKQDPCSINVYPALIRHSTNFLNLLYITLIKLSTKKKLQAKYFCAVHYPIQNHKTNILMKSHYLPVIVLCMLQFFAYNPVKAQNIAINNTGINPAASAMLDIQSTDKGLLIPQISLASLTDGSTIATPAHSLLIYNTNAALAEGRGYYYNSGTAGAVVWTRLAVSGTVWKIGGNTATVPGTDFIGTTDARGLMFKTNNIQSGYIDLTGTQNTSFGVRSLSAGGGLNNVAIGWNALKGNIMGNSNVAIGSNALVLNREGQNNIAIGSDALRFDSAGTTNVAVGGSSLYHSLGDNNTAVGNQSLHETTTGESNIGIGNKAGYYNSIGSKQVFINSLDRLDYTGDTSASPIYIQQDLITSAQRIKLNGRVIMPDLPAGTGTKAVRIDADGNLYAADTTNFAGSIWNGSSAGSFGDLVVPIYNTKPGEIGNQPAWSKLKDNGAGSRGVFTYAFAGATEQEVFFSIQMPLNWKEGSSILPRVHWSPQTSGQPGTVVWGIEYSWVNYNAATPQSFPNTTVMTVNSVSINGTTTIGQHLVTVFDPLTPGSTPDKAGSVLMCRFFRKGGDAADTYNGNAAVLSIDFHYEIGAVGNRTEL